MSRNLQMHNVRARGLQSARKLGLTHGASAMALLLGVAAAGAASAQTAAPAGVASVEEVVVTGTRVVRDGYQAPTPLTVISETEILAASIRHPIHVLDAARAGADVSTIPFKVFGQLVKHPLTDAGLEKFMADWDKAAK